MSEHLPLAEKLVNAKGWDNLVRQLMLAGKVLPTLPLEERVDENEVKGCQSRVWLSLRFYGVAMQMLAWSDSKIIRGVLAVVQEKVDTLDVHEVNDFDFDAYFGAVGLHQYLSQSRANGVKDVVARIKRLASAV